MRAQHLSVRFCLVSYHTERKLVYFVEADELRESTKPTGDLSCFAFRRLEELKLAKDVLEIDTGKVAPTPAEHKASGVANVVQAVGLSREDKPLSAITAKLDEAIAKVREGRTMAYAFRRLIQTLKYYSSSPQKRATTASCAIRPRSI